MTRIGHKIISLDLVDSTNNYVANLVKQGSIVHGTVILADEQTNGRGQRGTIWQTQPGMNLIFSLYVEFDALAIENQSSIHHWVSLSVIQVLKKIGLTAKIKWPNDILTENGKIAGVLIENLIENQIVKSSIIGIGLNVNQVEFAENVNATSLKLEMGTYFNVKEFAFMLVNELDNKFPKLSIKDYVILKTEYLENLWGMNEKVNFIRNNSLENGVILGTNDSGLLKVQTVNGVELFDLKEVKFIVD